MKTIKRGSYREAIKWIAKNGFKSDMYNTSAEFIATFQTVRMIASMFDKHPIEVAGAILRCRKSETQAVKND